MNRMDKEAPEDESTSTVATLLSGEVYPGLNVVTKIVSCVVCRRFSWK
jgi:hypothetical protein